MKRILIIKGTSQYDQFRYICDEMELAFAQPGCTVSVLDLLHCDLSSLNTDMFSDYDLIFSFNCIGIEIYNCMKSKPLFWTFLVDHPFYHDSRLKQIKDNVMVSCIDRNHVEYIDRFYKNIPWTCFLPHGGLTGEPLPQIPYEKRLYDVSLLGSLGNPVIINSEIDNLRLNLGDVVTHIASASTQYLNDDLEKIVYDHMTSIGMSLDNDMFTDIMAVLVPIDRLRRYKKRLSLVNSLTSNGIKVNIWGNGWENNKDLTHWDSVIFHANVGYNEANQIMRNSKIVLNDMPLFHDGSHERVFATMQSGAIAATDRSGFLEEIFTDKQDLVFYDIYDIDTLSDIIMKLITDKTTAQSMIDHSIMVSDRHTWKNRAAAILEIANEL